MKPGVIRDIAFKEAKELIRDGRFRISALTIFILLLISVGVSKTHYQRVQQQHTEAKEHAREHWENQGEKNPHGAAHYGTYLFKPQYAMSMLDQGLAKYLGVSLFLEGHKQNETLHRPIQDSSALARFAELTPAFIFTYLVPLFIILLSFSAFTREKEMGTLKIVLSQGVPMPALAIGKIVGIWMILLLLLVPAFVIGGIFLLSSAGVENEAPIRMIIWSLMYLVYFGVIINLSIGVSAIVKTSNISLVILLGFWIVSCLLVPKAVTNIAKIIVPTPTSIEYNLAVEKALNEGMDGHDPFNDYAQEFREKTLKEHGVDDVKDLPFNFTGLILQESEEYEKQVYDQHTKQLQSLFREQLSIHKIGAIFSPTQLIQLLSMGISSTDLEGHYHFKNAAENYRISLVRSLNNDLKDNSKYGQRGYTVGAEFYKTTPQFEYQALTLLDTIKHYKMEGILLFLWFILSLLMVTLVTKKSSFS